MGRFLNKNLELVQNYLLTVYIYIKKNIAWVTKSNAFVMMSQTQEITRPFKPISHS